MAFVVSAPSDTELRILRGAVRKRSASELNAHDIDDIAADIAVDAWRAASAKGAPFGGHAAVTARRPRYYTEARQAAREHRSLHQPTDEGFTPRPLDTSPLDLAAVPERPGVLRAVHEGEDGELELRDLLGRIPPHWARAVVLVTWYGYTLREAAGLLGVSLKTVHRWQEHGHAALAQSYRASLAA